MRTEGKHILMDVSGCNPEILNNLELLKSILKEAAEYANAIVLDVAFHHFTPQGVSGVVVISESHLSIHTWPEYGYAALDFYTCGDADPKTACEYVAEKLSATYIQTTEIKRGMKKNERYTQEIISKRVKENGKKLSVLP
ncbi:MAG: S-adenosylmethionine decarboxylase proenzyme [Caldisericaceae bacterium]|nr:S-adenosylmethionine decarboxylase proenzyme [Caldisericaceae bacterium]